MLIISSLGILSSVVFSVLLFRKKNKSYADKILIFWMLVFIVHLILPFMMSLENRFFIEKINGMDIGFYTLHITLAYYYSLSLTGNILKFKISHLEYLIPFASVYFVQGIIDSNVYLFEELIRKYFFNDTKIFHLTGVVILNLIFCIYFARKSFSVLSNHRARIKENYSYSENVDLIWLRNLFIATIIFTVIVSGYLFFLIIGKLNEEWINHLYFSSFSIFAMVLGFWGYKQDMVELPIKFERNKKQKKKEKIEHKIEICDDSSEEQRKLNKLLEIMKTEKLYLDASLNISKLADKLNVHSNYLSKCINSNLNKNFFEFVNEYRVEEFKKLVADPKNKNFTILGLAYDSGFNSKATFNRIFKKMTGQTPSQFRANYKF
jgi:AraC-like DNA-binding protein